MLLSRLFGRKSSGRAPARVRLSVEALNDRITPSCGCELPPSQISGLVYVDQNKDGFAQDAEPRLEGVKVTLKGRTDDGEKVKLKTTTDAGGIFMFQGLDAGTYKLKVSTPKGYSPGDSSVGAFGGNPHHNTITKIEIPGGQSSGAYNFGEVVRSSSKRCDNDHGGPKGNNGVGNGLDPQPRGNPPANDGPGTTPGSPGNQTKTT